MFEIIYRIEISPLIIGFVTDDITIKITGKIFK